MLGEGEREGGSERGGRERSHLLFIETCWVDTSIFLGIPREIDYTGAGKPDTHFSSYSN